MKLNFSLVVIILAILSTSVTSCKKKCGYCQYNTASLQGTYTTTNGPVVCDDDGGVAEALSNAQAACSAANQSVNGNPHSGSVYTTWINK